MRETLALHPEAGPVFERHGLLGCGGQAGPDERLDFFAAVHRVNLESLLSELRVAISGPVVVASTKAIGPAELAATLYRRFIWVALSCTLTLGASFGAYNLLVIHLALGTLPAEHNWVHASFQLFGFVLLFVMGVAYHTLPRFLGTPLRPLLAARASFPLALAGLLLRGYGQFGLLLPWTAPSLLAGAILQASALLCFAGVLGATYRKARPKLEPFHCYLAAATLWWLVAGALLIAEGVVAVRTGDSGSAHVLQEPLYLAVLFGGTLSFIEGMLLRAGPVFLNLTTPSRAAAVIAFWIGQLGAALAVFGAGAIASDGSALPLDLGLLALSASVTVYCVATRVFSARPGLADDKDPAFAGIIHQAFAWLLVFAGLATAYAALDLAGQSAPGLLFDGLRHAFALGFVTLMIFGMASRIVPIFGGASLRWPRLRTAGAYLISAGVALRELEVVALLGFPWLLHLSACSGLVAATGVALASASILGTLTASQTGARPAADVPISPDANVYELVTAHPEALPVLIRGGFAPLASPLARSTLARAVSLRQACKLHGKDAEALAAEIREACAREHLVKPAPVSRALAPVRPPPEVESAPPLLAPARPIDPEAVVDVLTGILDPDIGMNIVDLGLIYDVDLRPSNSVHVRMTLTSPHCPHGQYMAAEVDEALRAMPGVGEVEVELTFDPAWSPERMAPAARAAVGLG